MGLSFPRVFDSLDYADALANALLDFRLEGDRIFRPSVHVFLDLRPYHSLSDDSL
jgi:hypothetical protein